MCWKRSLTGREATGWVWALSNLGHRNLLTVSPHPATFVLPMVSIARAILRMQPWESGMFWHHAERSDWIPLRPFYKLFKVLEGWRRHLFVFCHWRQTSLSSFAYETCCSSLESAARLWGLATLLSRASFQFHLRSSQGFEPTESYCFIFVKR